MKENISIFDFTLSNEEMKLRSIYYLIQLPNYGLSSEAVYNKTACVGLNHFMLKKYRDKVKKLPKMLDWLSFQKNMDQLQNFIWR